MNLRKKINRRPNILIYYSIFLFELYNFIYGIKAEIQKN